MPRFRKSTATLGEIEAVYTRRFAEYASVAAAILQDRDAGRDVVQEAFAKAVRTRTTFRSDGSLDAWLWRTVVNTALSERRRRSRAVEQPRVCPAPASNGHDSGGDVAAAIALLPERQRLVLFLRYYADLDYAAIADVAGVATGTVGATLNAAHEALRRRLEEVRA